MNSATQKHTYHNSPSSCLTNFWFCTCSLLVCVYLFAVFQFIYKYFCTNCGEREWAPHIRALWIFYIYLFLATTLLVAGSTLTFGYLGRLCLYPPVRTQASFKALHCAHVMWLPRCSIDQDRVSHGGQNEDKTLLQSSPQGWVSAHIHQCTTAITTMYTEFSWAFPESYTADDSWIVHSSDCGQCGDKRAHNSTTKVSFCTINIIRLCHWMIAITTV